MSLWISNILIFTMGSFIFLNIFIFLVKKFNIFQHLVQTKMTMISCCCRVVPDQGAHGEGEAQQEQAGDGGQQG